MDDRPEVVLLAEYQKSAHEVLQVRRLRFGGQADVVEVRGWYPDETGDWRPGTGFAIPREQLRELIGALVQAEQALASAA